MAFFTIIGYFIITVAIAVVCRLLLPKSSWAQNRNVLWQFVVVAVFIPVVGVMAVIVGTCCLWFAKQPELDYRIRTFKVPPFLRRTVAKPVTSSEGKVYEELFDYNANKYDQIETLITINTFSARLVNKVNRKLLNSPNYGVRLYAFNILNKQERTLERIISSTKKELAATDNAKQKPRLEKALAFLYWELVYRNILQTGFMKTIIKEVVSFANSALAKRENDLDLIVLLGRVSLLEKKYDLSESYFKKALELNVPYSRVVPYLAELCFEKRDFRSLRKYLKMDDNIKDIPIFSPLVAYWSQHD